ncbi:MAG: ATP-binding protein [Porticoccaceae bacterium]|jgi:lon-related putative ATP-dependent protease|nr:ATP-binding protein [Porticoccaceae bacterium]HLS99558.1 ATP-binding protein [Porticoccaceae bacterium]
MRQNDNNAKPRNFRQPLLPSQLYRACEPGELPFATTDDLEPLEDHFGQERATEALRFGLDMRHDGYNLFLLGSPGVGKHELLDDFLGDNGEPLAPLRDWCYVNNFDAPHKPIALALPMGMGRQLRTDMAHCVEDLLASIPAAFQSDEYQSRLQEMGEQYSQREQQAFQELGEKARAENIALIQTPNGYTLAPMRDDKILSPPDFEALPEEEQKHTLEVIEGLKTDLKAIVRQLPLWVKEGREKLRQLNREFSRLAVDQLFAELCKRYEGLPQVLAYLDEVKADVVENVDAFRGAPGEGPGGQEHQKPKAENFPQYSVNVLVDNSPLAGEGAVRAPVIHEDNPSFINLVGRIEHTAQFGTLFTDFTLIKPGAFHAANGGYLVLAADKVLSNPFAWEALKRIVRSREIRVQSLEQMFSFASTTQLEPEPIPLDIKVILTGDRYLYYLLEQYDPEFAQLFKVAADMAEEVRRTPETTLLFARLVKSLQQRHGVKPLQSCGVGKIIEHCARQVEDNLKISLHQGRIGDLLCEADYWARQRGGDLITGEDVDRAIDAGIRRMDQFRERSHESILRNVMLVDTEGAKVAQVNGLSVYQLGAYAFGKPMRITATARLGAGRVMDIEREVRLGGKIHAKGVMIISALLADRYARNQPLPLSATLAFEQSYGGIEGDSASVAELTALISALSGIPVRQDLAVTGSLNQHGQVQPIGGANEKIEGFFAICEARGLSGKQGVIIPSANVEHLMLRKSVVSAIEQQRFHIYAVATIDEALELLMGTEAGAMDADGQYPPASINGRVMARIAELIALHRKFAGPSGDEGDKAATAGEGDDES